jgi:putative endonuclease
MRDEQSCGVYILTNTFHTVFYVGMSTNLPGRILSHKQKLVDGFASKYNCIKFVYFENALDKWSALEREKQIKKYSRFKKIQLILSLNPDWNDLSPSISLETV